MSWIVLIISGCLEAVWATALGRSEGFTKLVPTIVFGVALVASMGGLAYAMRDISTGTAYAVWVGIGASLTVAYAMITGDAAGASQGGQQRRPERDRRGDRHDEQAQHEHRAEADQSEDRQCGRGAGRDPVAQRRARARGSCGDGGVRDAGGDHASTLRSAAGEGISPGRDSSTPRG